MKPAGALDRRALLPGLVLVAIGLATLLSRTFNWMGPAPILLSIGTAFFTLSALSRFRGPLLPAGVCLGLGAGFLAQSALEPAFPGWASILLGLGLGFLLVAAIDGLLGRRREPRPVLPGLILTGIALLGSRRDTEALFVLRGWLQPLWPAALIAAGILLIAAARRRRAT